MQRIRLDGRRIVFFVVIPLVIFFFLLFLDFYTKNLFRNIYSTGSIEVIPNFLILRYVTNSGSAFSFLANKDWGQLFFKILTPIALIAFIFVLIYSIKINSKWLSIAIVLVITGTVGNFIDRIFFNCVTDFISFKFGSYFFPIFNFADCYLTVGIIMLIIYLFFLSKNALFKKNEKKDIS